MSELELVQHGLTLSLIPAELIREEFHFHCVELDQCFNIGSKAVVVYVEINVGEFNAQMEQATQNGNTDWFVQLFNAHSLRVYSLAVQNSQNIDSIGL